MEEEYIRDICSEIIKHKPDVVITEKGLSDLAMHFLTKAGISAIRRLRKTDNNRIARACGATIVHRAEGMCCEACRCLQLDKANDIHQNHCFDGQHRVLPKTALLVCSVGMGTCCHHSPHAAHHVQLCSACSR